VLRSATSAPRSNPKRQDTVTRDTHTGTPQGGILSPLLANVALSVLDEHFASAWQTTMATRYERERRRRHGHATYRICRYADDFVVMVSGTRAHAEALRSEVETVLAPMGLHLSEAKTGVVHIDEGLDFLGFRIQRHTQEGSTKRYVYTYPSKKALASIKRKVKTISRQGTNQPLTSLLRQLNAVLRGWTNYFRNSAAAATFGYLRHYTWWRVVKWLRRKHRKMGWKKLRRRFLRINGKTWVGDDGMELFDPAAVTVIRYRYRGAQIPTPWDEHTTETA
jgi:RNA-directed DNA polymerase